MVEACWQMHDCFNPRGVFERLCLPAEKCIQILDSSDSMNQFRSRLFTCIAPTIRDINLFGPKVRHAFSQTGCLHLAEVDAEAMLANDERVAEEYDIQARMAEVVPAPGTE